MTSLHNEMMIVAAEKDKRVEMGVKNVGLRIKTQTAAFRSRIFHSSLKKSLFPVNTSQLIIKQKHQMFPTLKPPNSSWRKSEKNKRLGEKKKSTECKASTGDEITQKKS